MDPVLYLCIGLLPVNISTNKHQPPNGPSHQSKWILNSSKLASRVLCS